MRLKQVAIELNQVAVDYHQETGRRVNHPTSEISEREAAAKMGLTLAPNPSNNAGWDAKRKSNGDRVQIKGKGPGKWNGKLGGLNPPFDFDTVMLVLLNDAYDADEIWEAQKVTVLEFNEAELSNGLTVAKFKKVSDQVWPKKGDAEESDAEARSKV